MRKVSRRSDTPASMTTSTRMERDTMGELPVPSNAYYGVQTARAIENFPISSLRIPRAMIRAMGLIKRAAASVNHSLKLLDKKPADAIIRAATEVVEGHLDAEFPVDIFQTACPPTVMVTSLPITWAQTMVTDSAMTGLTLPGMMDDPG